MVYKDGVAAAAMRRGKDSKMVTRLVLYPTLHTQTQYLHLLSTLTMSH